MNRFERAMHAAFSLSMPIRHGMDMGISKSYYGWKSMMISKDPVGSSMRMCFSIERGCHERFWIFAETVKSSGEERSCE